MTSCTVGFGELHEYVHEKKTVANCPEPDFSQIEMIYLTPILSQFKYTAYRVPAVLLHKDGSIYYRFCGL